MLAAVPSGEIFINKNSNAVKKTGNAKIEYHAFIFMTARLVIIIIKAKSRERVIVNMMAGTRVATVTR